MQLIFFREHTRLPQRLLAGIADRTSAVTQTEAIHSFLAKFLRQTENCEIQVLLGFQDRFLIFIAADFMDGLQYQRLVRRKQSIVNFFYRSTGRWAGIVGIVLSAKIVLAEFAKRSIYRNILCRNNCRGTCKDH